MMADMHVHSTFSPDAQHSIGTMCLSAVERGISILCFTEHYDLNPAAVDGLLDFDAYRKAIDTAREKYNGQLTVLQGIEFSEPHLYQKEFDRVCSMDFDVVMAAVHWYDNYFYGDPCLHQQCSAQKIYERYFTEMAKMVTYGGFDIVAHLDFLKRYLPMPEEMEPMLFELVRILAKKTAALEINTASIRKGNRECNPDKKTLNAFALQGGKRITLGSDAHCQDDVGEGVRDMQVWLNRLPTLQQGVFLQRTFMPLAEFGHKDNAD